MYEKIMLSVTFSLTIIMVMIFIANKSKSSHRLDDEKNKPLPNKVAAYFRVVSLLYMIIGLMFLLLFIVGVLGFGGVYPQINRDGIDNISFIEIVMLFIISALSIACLYRITRMIIKNTKISPFAIAALEMNPIGLIIDGGRLIPWNSIKVLQQWKSPYGINTNIYLILQFKENVSDDLILSDFACFSTFNSFPRKWGEKVLKIDLGTSYFALPLKMLTLDQFQLAAFAKRYWCHAIGCDYVEE